MEATWSVWQKCQVEKISSWLVDEMANWHNHNSQVDEMQVDEMSSWQSVKLTKCQVDQMSS